MGGPAGIPKDEVAYNAEISRRIEFLRKRRGVTGSELARAIGVSPAGLYHYEVGSVRWPVFRLRLIADYFRVPVVQLMPKSLTCVASPAAQRELI